MFLEFFFVNNRAQAENAEFLLLKRMSYSDTKSRGRRETKVMQLIFTPSRVQPCSGVFMIRI